MNYEKLLFEHEIIDVSESTGIDDIDLISGVSLQHLSRELKYNFVDCYTQYDVIEPLTLKPHMNSLAENIIPGHIIEAGSRVEETMTPTHEGYQCSLVPDSDFMYEINKSVLNDTLSVEPTDCPGFVRLILTSKDNLHYFILQAIKQDKTMWISPLKFKAHISHALYILVMAMKGHNKIDLLEGFLADTEIVGPAIRLKCYPETEENEPDLTWSLADSEGSREKLSDNLKLTEMDFVPAFAFENWPPIANEWIKRARKWPPPPLVQNIIQYGFHVVAKSSSKETEDYEWRISFAKANSVLLKSIDKYSWCKQCYRIFKCLIKYYFSHPKLITTFHCKTVFLWTLERFPPDSWTFENLGQRFLGLLDSLLHALVMGRLSEYFIPYDNLFSKFEPDCALTVMQKISEMRREPFRFIYRIGTQAWNDELQGMTIDEMLHWNDKPETERFPGSDITVLYERNK